MAKALAAAACTLAVWAADPARAGAQGADPRGAAVPQVYTDHVTGRLVYITELPGRTPGVVKLGHVSGIYWFLNPLNPLQPGFGCRFIQPVFQHLVRCDPPPNGFLVKLGPGPNDVHVLPSVPELLGPNRIEGGKKRDVVRGGRNDERVDAGKGNDVVNPGKGRDQVNLGAGNDTANTRDGERDVVNGGKGKKDSAKVDRFDKVKNVEKVIRK